MSLDRRKLENGSFRLLESGSKRLLESSSGPSAASGNILILFVGLFNFVIAWIALKLN